MLVALHHEAGGVQLVVGLQRCFCWELGAESGTHVMGTKAQRTPECWSEL